MFLWYQDMEEILSTNCKWKDTTVKKKNNREEEKQYLHTAYKGLILKKNVDNSSKSVKIKRKPKNGYKSLKRQNHIQNDVKRDSGNKCSIFLFSVIENTEEKCTVFIRLTIYKDWFYLVLTSGWENRNPHTVLVGI